MADSISGLSGSGGGDMMRIIGMASGMDVDGMIKKMMLAEGKKVDKVKQQRQAIVWKQELYQDIIKDVKNLQNTYFSATSGDSLISSKAYSDFKVESTNSAVATATATSGAVSGNYTVNVTKMARGAGKESDEFTTLDGKRAQASNTMKDLGATAADKFEIVLDGKTIEIDVNQDDKISDVVATINKKGDGNVKATYSELTGKLNIETSKTGTGINLAVNNSSTNLLKLNTTIVSQNAEVTITPPGGAATTIERNSNNFTIDGINYNLQGVSTTTVSVSQDTDKTFDRFKTFIDKYNSLIDKINTRLTEKKDYDYKPLTDAQKKDMKDEDIKAWEEKAKKGVLRNDDNLKNMLSQLRSTFFEPVEGISAKFGRSIGLDTEGKPSKAGQIKFSDDTGEAFKKALSERPEEIIQLFNKTSDASNKKDAYKQSGIFQRISTILKDNVGFPGVTSEEAILTKYSNKQEDYSITGVSGYNTLPDQIYRKDNLIKTLNSKLKDKENSLYKKFSALEVVMNKYNSQNAWLSQQFGG